MHTPKPAARRWYPLTYPGAYTETLQITDNLDWEHCKVDVSAYRGQTLGIGACCDGEGHCALTDDHGAVLACWQEPPAALTVPETARTLYLSNHHTVHSDFYLTVPEDLRSTLAIEV